MPNSNKSTNLTKIPDHVWIFFVMLFQYLNCVFNIQSQHGKLGNAATFFTKHRENGLKLTFLYCPVRLAKLVWPCIAEYVRIPSYRVRLHFVYPMKDFL